ncbi:PAS domain-containing sensor histidine kinase [Bacteroidota bacterium]
MKLKYQFILYLLFLHGVIAFFAFDYFVSQKYWFLIVEAGLITSFFIAFRIYRHLIRPLELISSGIQSIRDRDFTISYRNVGSKELDELISVYNSMMEQLREERTIQQEQHFFLQKLMDAAPIGIIILDGNEKIRQLNHMAEEILGVTFDGVAGTPLGDLSSPFTEPMLCLREDVPVTLRLNGLRNFRVSKSHFMNLGFRNSFILIDELTNEMLAAEKEAFGKAIRMMSHEVNNSIGATNSILQTLKSFSKSVSEEKEQMESAIDIVMDRNTNLNRFMNNLADVIRLPAPTLSRCDLNKQLNSLVNLMEPYCMNKKVSLTLSIPPNPYLVEIDPVQIEQMLVNVIKNAVESISGEGQIVVTLDSSEDQLTVEDTGQGILPEVQAKLFTPFYSSKKNGQGIGLTITREIAHQHGFVISLTNRPTGGAVFKLTFRK